MADTKQETPKPDSENKEKKATEEKEQELTEEDKQLQDELNMLVERLMEPNQSLYHAALESLRTKIRSSTTSMTSVPKPLKFLRPHYGSLKEVYVKIKKADTRQFCADIISVLGMTMSENFDCLEYRLLGSSEEIGSWGHEYVRHLAGEIAQNWQSVDSENNKRKEELLCLAKQVVPHHMAHNAEAEGCDLLMEIERLDLLTEYIDESTYQRVCLYLTSCVPYVADPENVALLKTVVDLYCKFKPSDSPYSSVGMIIICTRADPENVTLLKTAVELYRKFKQSPQALRYAMQLNDMELVKEIFDSCTDGSIKRQLAYMLGQQHICLDIDVDDDDYDDLCEMMSNNGLSRNFLTLASELDIMEPKVPEDIYKTHLEPTHYTMFLPTRTSTGTTIFSSEGCTYTIRIKIVKKGKARNTIGANNIDSARQNLASSFVNGFVNAGFGQDKLLKDEGVKWLHKNREHGMLSATASLGLILLWDVDGGLSEIDKYFHSTDKYIQAGALVACGVVNAGIKHDCDPALALLKDYIPTGDRPMQRIGAIIGLGLAYAGSNRSDVIELLLPVLGDTRASMELIGFTGLSCGMICVGSCNGDVTSVILQTMMERSNADIKDNFMRFVALGLALNYLGKQEEAEVALASLEVIREPLKSMARLMVDICAYAGTGNVLKVQELLHICSEHDEKEDKDKKDEKKDDKTKDKKDEKSKDKKKDEKEDPEAEAKSDLSQQQAIAVLGIALIAAGEDIGSEMSYRAFGHLLRYGEPVIRRCVPLALALLYTSNPSMQIIDTLSKFSHDSDPEVAHCSIFAMGMVGAGTNNARLAAMLRHLAVYHVKDANNLFMVRIAQGLTHLGKGTLTLSPFHSDRALLSPVAVAGLMSVLVACMDVKNTILGKSHYVLYYISPAIHPRMLITFDEQLNKLPVSIRVGQAVDVVGQAGKPKTITGFQTHTTPVLLAYGERAELATEEYIALTPIMEGSVILRKNPDYEA